MLPIELKEGLGLKPDRHFIIRLQQLLPLLSQHLKVPFCFLACEPVA